MTILIASLLIEVSGKAIKILVSEVALYRSVLYLIELLGRYLRVQKIYQGFT
jgi:hypothetical protein